MTESRNVHVLIHGFVQGVSFRAWTQHQAQLHGLCGWVRNRRDGAVEAVFSGSGDLVDVIVGQVRCDLDQHGLRRLSLHGDKDRP